MMEKIRHFNKLTAIILVYLFGMLGVSSLHAHRSTCHNEPHCHPTEYEKNWLHNFFGDVKRDYCLYFQKDNLLLFGDFFVAAGILANTGLDRSIAQRWQDDIRSNGSNNFFKFWNSSGGLSYAYVPLYLTVMALGHMREENLFGNVVYAWGYRSLRAIILGGPQEILLAHALGSGRPSLNQDSKWQPFHNDKGVSGHAFYGAIPFLTAAMMTDPPLIRWGLYIVSTFPGLARINSNAHYTSQVLLGWALAFLSARSIYASDMQRTPLYQVSLYPKSDGLMLRASLRF